MLSLWIKPLLVLASASFFFGALPSTTNYSLQSYGFGSGGTANSGTANYSLEGITGELSGQTGATTNYNLKPGYIETQQANVPKVTLTNPSSYYDKLKFVIDQQNNPPDAKYALQVCVGFDWTPNCGGTTLYVKSDDTLGSTLTATDYQTYSGWGGASGTTIAGLTANTTYYIRAKATQGEFTESAYGPSSSAATIKQSITFCLYTSATCVGGGTSESFGKVVPGAAPVNSPTNIGVNLDTNADNGAMVWIASANGGMKSLSNGYQINSATADLATAAQGYGAQIASVSQTSGGPFNKFSPYDGSSNNVGGLSTTLAQIFYSTGPLVGGKGAIQLQLKADKTTPPAADYSDTLTVVAAANF